MQFLGAFEAEADLILSIEWEPLEGEDPVTGAEVLLKHASSTDVIGPVEADLVAENTFEALVNLPRSGRWKVTWTSTPPGGRSDSVIYVE